MKFNDAFKRALRTFAQSLAAALLALGPVASAADIKVQGSIIVLALYTSALAAVISFLQNVGEDSTPIQLLPK